MFRNCICLILSCLFILLANQSGAEDILLRNGKILGVQSFWEKDDQIMFERYGSVVGISTKSVKEIRSNQAVLPSNDESKTWQDPVTGMEFVWIPDGCFNTLNRTDASVVEVCLDGFWMGIYEVTNSQFRQFNPSHNSASYYQDHYLGEDDQPAVNVSGEKAQAFADWLTESNQAAFNFSLPTEAQWEYAGIGGSNTAFFWGDDVGPACYYGNFKDAAWQNANQSVIRVKKATCYDGFIGTAPVGRFKSNPLGLHDIVGNVSEWCVDQKVARGSSFISDPNLPIADQRYFESFSSFNHWTGFRLVMLQKIDDGFDTVSDLNEYGGQTKKLVEIRKDYDFERGAWHILYFLDADGNLVKKEVIFNNTYAAEKGIFKKVFYENKRETFYTAESATEKGFNKVTIYSTFDLKKLLRKLKLINS